MTEFDQENFYDEMRAVCAKRDLPGVPLYESIRRKLQEMIVNGEFPEGCQLPTDRELSQKLNVNHITLGRALNELRKCGLLFRSPSKGTFVCWSEADKGDKIVAPEKNRVLVAFDDVNIDTFQSDLFVTLHNGLLRQKPRYVVFERFWRCDKAVPGHAQHVAQSGLLCLHRMVGDGIQTGGYIAENQAKKLSLDYSQL